MTDEPIYRLIHAFAAAHRASATATRRWPATPTPLWPSGTAGAGARAT